MVATYRYGETRTDFALRIGVSRQTPRARQAPFDLWLRALSPSAALESRFRKKLISFSGFASAYRREMRRTEPRQLIDLVAFLAREQPISLGCFCEREDLCHRSILQGLIEAAALPRTPYIARRESSSPVCFMSDDF